LKSVTNRDFRTAYTKLPETVREQAHRAYRLWRENPNHPSLRFKPVLEDPKVYSVRVGLGWRALCLVEDDTAIWFWIGSHADYDRILSR
jgi:hypothetical protein